ncbi:MAG TPA: DUF2784 domain-containing protein [Acidobacteriota bacterium]|jgi:hypothetical protein|nr:DUF2784 domain-containing protein [Acidobacteriota bacterium]HRR25640.1 DUF2784 domain-containing protein [Acidobacteriota bacterium]HRR55444.1 DUF2784 domain-containing protein [Acidobacteriota bacterium]HRV08842.1 DUF2784 domain-containing protein [Acidobacteriota bacterium]
MSATSSVWILKWLDGLFFVFHTGLILFVLLGWIRRPLLGAHLFVLLLTGFSWFILGLRYGIGYCPCTDWHWEIRRRLGDSDLPYSYVQFLLSQLGLDVGAKTADVLAGTVFFAALGVSLIRNFQTRR